VPGCRRDRAGRAAARPRLDPASFLDWCRTVGYFDRLDRFSDHDLDGRTGEYQNSDRGSGRITLAAGGQHATMNREAAAHQLAERVADDRPGLGDRPALPYRPGNQCPRCGPAGFWSCRCT
jgi:hypothetical protein